MSTKVHGNPDSSKMQHCGKVCDAKDKVEECESPPQPQQQQQPRYRLNLTEIESTLAAVPEDSALLQQQNVEDAAATFTSPTHDHSCSNSVYFHIPESNASDFASSECSLANGPDVLTKTEALSAKQQVALWLTRTSTSDTFPKNQLKATWKGACSSRRKEKSMSRNQSTKSLMGGFSFNLRKSSSETKSRMKQNDGVEDHDVIRHSTPIRKCETETALPGLSSNNSSCVNLRSSKQKPCDLGSKRSSLSSFQRLSRDGSRLHGTTASRGTLFGYGNRSGSESTFVGILPVNRLRSTSSIFCSRCTSGLSINNSRTTSRATSQLSLFRVSSLCGKMSATTIEPSRSTKDVEEVLCKICLTDCLSRDMVELLECGCTFCKDCMSRYVSFEVMEGAYEISCPDQYCEKQGVLQMSEVENLVGKDLMDKHRTFRLNTEVAMDSNRAWCPRAGCETICHICASPGNNIHKAETAVAVKCPTCQKEFCSLCSANCHPRVTCQENGRALVRRGKGQGANTPSLMGDVFVFGDGKTRIKRCPMCQVPIERNAGCAQMMCKRCKHVFCWFCLTSLDDDFLLRHYDSGKCKGRLGHTRASVLWHRAQVIGLFAGFGVVLVIASPLLLLAAPCILFCDCKNCQKTERIPSSVQMDGGDFVDQNSKKDDFLGDD